MTSALKRKDRGLDGPCGNDSKQHKFVLADAAPDPRLLFPAPMVSPGIVHASAYAQTARMVPADNNADSNPDDNLGTIFDGLGNLDEAVGVDGPALDLSLLPWHEPAPELLIPPITFEEPVLWVPTPARLAKIPDVCEVAHPAIPRDDKRTVVEWTLPDRVRAAFPPPRRVRFNGAPPGYKYAYALGEKEFSKQQLNWLRALCKEENRNGVPTEHVEARTGFNDEEAESLTVGLCKKHGATFIRRSAQVGYTLGENLATVLSAVSSPALLLSTRTTLWGKDVSDSKIKFLKALALNPVRGFKSNQMLAESCGVSVYSIISTTYHLEDQYPDKGNFFWTPKSKAGRYVLALWAWPHVAQALGIGEENLPQEELRALERRIERRIERRLARRTARATAAAAAAGAPLE
jgi:hypothetical protein